MKGKEKMDDIHNNTPGGCSTLHFFDRSKARESIPLAFRVLTIVS